MLKNIKNYDEILESFSKPLLSLITNYVMNMDGELIVREETLHYYQYIDYTRISEYLFD